jgi:hypothetical protein
VQPVLTTAIDTVSTLSSVAGAIAPLEAVAQPVLATVTDTVSTLPNDVAGAIAPVEAAVQPVLTTATDTVSTLPNDVAGAIAPVEAAVQPVLTTATDTVSTLSNDVVGADPSSHGFADTSNVAALHVGSAGWVSGAVTPVPPHLVDVPQAAGPDTTGGLTDHAVASAAPVVNATEPVLTTTAAAVGNPTSDVSHPADTNVAIHAPANAAPVVDTSEPVFATTAAAVSNPTSDVSHPADTGNVASDALASAAPVVDTTEPVLASAGVSLSNPATDLLQPAVPDTSTGQAPGPADTLLALATATDAPIEVPGSVTAAPANVATDVSNAAAAVDPTAIAGDVIALKDAPQPPANALFTGNQYTDYGVTLSSDIAVSPQHAVSPADTTSAHDTLVPVVADAQQHAPPPPDIVDTTHPIDHLGHAML